MQIRQGRVGFIAGVVGMAAYYAFNSNPIVMKLHINVQPNIIHL